MVNEWSGVRVQPLARDCGMRIAIAAAMLLWAGDANAQVATVSLAPGETLLRVSTTGTVKTQPDQITITAGVVSQGRTTREALAANNTTVARMIGAVRASGIDSADVTTSELGLKPRFSKPSKDSEDDESFVAKPIGYTVTNKVAVRLHDLARAGMLLSALVEAGANSIDGPDFAVADPRPVEARARAAAVAEAGTEAQTYADAAHMRIARVLTISDRSTQSNSNYSDEMIVVTDRRKIVAPPIEPGSINTRATVWVDYALVPR